MTDTTIKAASDDDDFDDLDDLFAEAGIGHPDAEARANRLLGLIEELDSSQLLILLPKDEVDDEGNVSEDFSQHEKVRRLYTACEDRNMELLIEKLDVSSVAPVARSLMERLGGKARSVGLWPNTTKRQAFIFRSQREASPMADKLRKVAKEKEA